MPGRILSSWAQLSVLGGLRELSSQEFTAEARDVEIYVQRKSDPGSPLEANS